MKDIVGIDFETYWAKDYSLSDMTTDGYVLDPRFKVHGASVWQKSVHDKPIWLTGRFLEIYLAGVDWSTTALLAHNTAFDGFIVTHHYGHKPCFYLDTMSMARAQIGVQVGASLRKVAEHYKLGTKGDELINTKGIVDLSPQQLAKLGEYAITDLELCMAAFKVMAPEFNATELSLINTTIRMFTEPCVLLNASLMETALLEERTRKADILQRSGATKEVLGSNKQFAELLFMFGVDAPKKISPTTGKETYALAKTDAGFVELLEHDDEAIRTLAEARLSVKSTLSESRTERLLAVARDDRPWPVLLNYYGAGTTGRWSGGNNQNPQNLPSGRKGTSKTLRNSVEAPPGHQIVVADSAQIEARTLAEVAGQTDLLEVFRDGGDPYARMATAFYKREIKKGRDDEERQVGKTMVLGCGYGMGGPKFRATLKNQTGISMTEQEAALAVLTYRAANPKIVQLWRLMDDYLRIMIAGGTLDCGYYSIGPQGIRLPNGMWIKYPDLRQDADGFSYATRRGRAKIYGGKAVENLIQALARIIVAEQMYTLERRFLARIGGRVWLMAHDEVCLLVPTLYAEAAKKAALLVMSTPPAWAPNLPVSAEAGIGDTYGSAK